MIEYGIRTKLLATSAVTALLGGATKAAEVVTVVGGLAQFTRYPAVTITRIDAIPEYDMEGPAGLETARLQIDCWDQTTRGRDHYDGAQQVANAVQTALSGFTGSAGDYTVQRSFLLARRPLGESDASILRESLDFEIAYAPA